MNDSVDDRLVDETLVAYVRWREESSGAQDAYRRWSTAPLSEETDAFGEYVAALNNEEGAANHYAELIRRLSQQASIRSGDQGNQRGWRPARSRSRRRGDVTRGL